MNLDTAARTINIQQDIKVAELEELICADYEKSDKLWSDLPTSPYTTTFAEGIIHVIAHRSSLYTVVCVGKNMFQVKFIGDIPTEQNTTIHEPVVFDEDEFKSVPLPLFCRVRDVAVLDDGTLICGCCHFESCGLFCSHQVAVSRYVHECNGIEYSGFTHHDVLVRWTSGYMHMAYDPSTPTDIQEFYHRLAKDGKRGPMLKVFVGDNIPIVEPKVHLPALQRLKNYKQEDVNFDNFDSSHTQTYNPAEDCTIDDNDEEFLNDRNYFYGLTQESTELVFNESINNAEIPLSMAGGMRTRDKLKQAWEEACANADDIGLSAVTELELSLKRFSTFCNEKMHDSSDNEEDDSVGRVVPMTQAKYKGREKRIYNTHHM